MGQANAADQKSTPLYQLGAAELARQIAARSISSAEVVESFIGRIEQVDQELNAVVVRRFEEAREEAIRADDEIRRGNDVGPLHGVPITVKECFHVKGTPSTIGLTTRTGLTDDSDGVLIRRLKNAGAIILGKTNVPQLMFCQECENPVYGRTNNPWNVNRSPGGSTGGEAAIIAAGGSPLGLGSDLGGSIRQPAHACGIHGLKPTSGRLPTTGMTTNFHGMEAVAVQPGPMARRVGDLGLALQVLSKQDNHAGPPDGTPSQFIQSNTPRLDQLRIGIWTDDGYFSPSPAIQRAVAEAASILESAGAEVQSIEPPDANEAVRLFCSLVASDGGRGMRQLLRGSKVDWRVSRLIMPARIPRLIRPAVFAMLRLLGQRKTSEFLRPGHARSAAEYWKLIDEQSKFTSRFYDSMDKQNLDALVFPPHGLPAMPHDDSIYLLAAASHCFVANLVGCPSGVVAATRVKKEEQDARSSSRDIVDRLTVDCDHGSEGLPVGVQVAARHWREDVVLEVMRALEEGFRKSSDYPIRD